MLNTLFGWYARQNLGCRFDNIIFSESVAAGAADYTVTLTNALDGAEKKNKLTGNNFIITEIHSVCTTGIISVKVLPDNDTAAKFHLQPYQAATKKLPSPVLLMADLVLVFDNTGQPLNEAYIAFEGFWINESNMAKFTLLSELIPETLVDIDVQTYAIMGILESMAAAEGIASPEGGWSYGGTHVGEVCKEFCKRRS